MFQSVLVIEDDKDLCEIFAELLGFLGMQVEHAVDGRQALDILTWFVPDIITLDIHLPHVSGLDILKQIHADTRFARTKIIVITADILLIDSLMDQADHILTKPVELDQLVSLLN